MNLRSARIRWLRGENSFPEELLPACDFAYHKLADSEANLAEPEKERLKEAVQKMASIASSHLEYAREKQGIIPSHARPALLPVIPAIEYLCKLEAARHDIFDASLSESNNLGVLLRMGRAWLTGIF